MSKEKIEKVDLCAKYLIVQMLNTGADTMTVTQEGFSFEGKVIGDFEVVVKKINKK